MRSPRTKTRLSPTALPLSLINFKLRLPRKISAVVGEVMEVIQSPESILPR